jgi:hypothetical protein
MLDEFGAEIAFEDLDDCCQKEVLQKRRHNAVTAALRTDDRSNRRFDLQANVFCSAKRICACCSSSADYPLLSSIRDKEKISGAVNDAVEEASEDGSDDEFLDAEFISTHEQERKDEFMRFQERAAVAESYGLRSHLEDSLAHVRDDILSGLSVVLHVYNRNELLCAKLDLFLEEIATKYIGTKFRRLEYTADLSERTPLASCAVKSSDVSPLGSLLCFRGKQLAVTMEVGQFGEDDVLYTQEVMKLLNGTGVLTDEVPLEILLDAKKLSKIATTEEEGNEASQAFCDDPDCTKKYAHEHIGGSNRTATFLLGARTQGSEALADGEFQRL